MRFRGYKKHASDDLLTKEDRHLLQIARETVEVCRNITGIKYKDDSDLTDRDRKNIERMRNYLEGKKPSTIFLSEEKLGYLERTDPGSAQFLKEYNTLVERHVLPFLKTF